jgi:hypothetical protein
MSFRPAQQLSPARLALRYILIIAITAVFLFPVYWLFMISFKTPDEIYHVPPLWAPGEIQFSSYLVLFKDGDVIAIWNSLVVAGVSSGLAIVLGTFCAYSLARFKTGGDNLANRGRVPDLPHLRAVRLGGHAFRPHPALHRLQPSLRDLDDARLHRRHSSRTRGIGLRRRLHALGDAVEGGVPHGALRPDGHGRVHLRLRLE